MKFVLVIVYLAHSAGFAGEFDTPWACVRAANELADRTPGIRAYCFAKDGPKPIPEPKKEKM